MFSYLLQPGERIARAPIIIVRAGDLHRVQSQFLAKLT